MIYSGRNLLLFVKDHIPCAKYGLTKAIFDEVGAMVGEEKLFEREGPIMDATIIATPSRKNQSGGRDPQMHQTKKGIQWDFGMKAHVGSRCGERTHSSRHWHRGQYDMLF
jgi:IS5 family transposase